MFADDEEEEEAWREVRLGGSDSPRHRLRVPEAFGQDPEAIEQFFSDDLWDSFVPERIKQRLWVDTFSSPN